MTNDVDAKKRRQDFAHTATKTYMTIYYIQLCFTDFDDLILHRANSADRTKFDTLTAMPNENG